MIELDTIYNMDCLEGMKMIPDGSVDAIISDLPYGSTACSWDSVIPFEPLWEQFKRVTKPNAAIVLFGSEPFSSALRMSNIGMYKYDWIWKKGERTANFYDAKRRPLLNHEVISVFYRSLPTYNPQMTKGEPNHGTKSGAVYQKQTLGSNVEYIANTSDEKYPKTIINFEREYDKDKLGLHPTQKPVDLLRYLILTYSNEGDTILDATMGSGTTAIAAMREKRHFVGFELNKEYFNKAVERINRERQQPALDFATE
jgi:site-specific DNA-methyltransferase (adenine-specific)